MDHTLAIAIVILPPPAIQAHCRQLNAELRRRSPNGFPLDDTHLPHVSLAQCFVRAEELPRLAKAIEAVAGLTHPFTLTVSRLKSVPLNQREVVTGFTFAPSNDIVRIHATVIEAAAPFETTGDDSAFVLDPGEVLDPSVIPYVTNFRRQASGPRFWPHITLGLGTLREAQLPPPFTADHLAVCQLGNNNTGRKILTAWHLKP